MSGIAFAERRVEKSAPPNMLWVPGGTFRMGSDRHYPEEAPVHLVTVSGFWIDRTPVTNRQFKPFVRATGHKTFAEILPDPKSYPGALPHMLYAGSLVFTPPHRPVDLKNFSEWWRYLKDANWRHPYGPKSNINALDNHPVVHVAYSDQLYGAEGAGDGGALTAMSAANAGMLALIARSATLPRTELFIAPPTAP
jgi:formylglycine-generating enzyme required for sulfatase activity